ncbi:MAG: PAS domain S-box protein [Ignavibacteria bacterium]|jgi:PAS domain S-box-containing protein
MKEERLIEELNNIKEENKRLKTKVKSLAVEIEKLRKDEVEFNKIKRSEKKYREIFNSTNDSIFIHNAETGNLVDVNKAMLEMYGYKYDEVFERSVEILNGAGDPYTIEAAKEKRDKAITEGPQVFDWLVKRKNGTKFWVEVSLRYCEAGCGNIVIAVVRDITERKNFEEKIKESEEKFSKAFQLNPNSVALITFEEGRYIDVNEAFAKIFGFTKKEVIGKTWTELNIWSNPSERKEVIEELKRKKKIHNKEIRFKTKKNGIIIGRYFAEIIEIRNQTCLLSVVEDITELTKAKKERDRLTNVVESTSDIIIINDPEGKIIYLNKAAKELYAFRRHKDQSKLKLNDFHPKWVRDILHDSALPAAIKNGMWLGETAVYGGIKNEIPVSQLLMAHKDNNGDIEYISSIMRDISERKQTEEALKESESKFRKLFESSTDAICILKDGYIVNCNNRTLKMFGCSKEQIIGSTPDIITPAFQADGSRSKVKLKERINAALKGEEQFFEWIFKKNNGAIFDTEVNFNLVEFDKGKFIQAIIRDITERKKNEKIIKASEERFRSFIEQTSEAINCYEFDPGIDSNLTPEKQAEKIFEGNLVECNDAFAKNYGFKETKECLGKKLIEFVGDDKKESIKNLFINFINNGYKIIDGESVEVLKNGSEKIFLNNAYGIIENGKLYRIWSAVRDITERKQLEKSITRQRDMLVQASKLSKIAFWEYDILNNKTIWSEELKQLLGDGSGEKIMSYDQGLDIVHKEDLQRIKGIDERIRNNEIDELENVEYRVVKNNGEIIWFWERGKVVKDKNGSPLKYSAVVQDITERKEIEKDLQVRLDFEKLVSKISNKFLGLSAEEIESEIYNGLKKIINFIGAQRITIFEFLNKKEIYSTYTFSAEGTPDLPYFNLAESLPRLAEQITNGRVILIRDISEIPEEAVDEIEYVRQAGIKSSITVPIKIAAKIVGAFNVTAFEGVKKWTQDDVNRLTILSEIIANAVNRLRYFRELEERSCFEQAISEVQSKLINIASEIFEKDMIKCLEIIAGNFAASRCRLLHFKEDIKNFEMLYFWNKDNRNPLEGLDYDKDFVWECEKIMKGENIVVNNIDDLPGIAENEKEYYVKQNIKSFLEVPIFVGNEIFGSIAVSETKKKRAWNKDDIPKLKIFGEILANSLMRKKTDEELRISETKFRSIVENSDDCIILVNEEGKIIEWNKGAEQLTGKLKEEVLNECYVNIIEDLSEIPSGLNYNGDQKIEQIENGLKSIDKNLYNNFDEFELHRPDGQIRFAAQNQFSIKRQKGYWLCNIVRDITEKKIYERSIAESEKRFRTLINTTTASIFIIQNFKVIFVNKCGEGLLGLTKENLQNVNILDLFTGEYKTQIMNQMNDTLKGITTGQVEAKIKNKDGSEFWVEYSSGLIDVDGKRLLIGTAVDITQRKQAEENLEKSKESYKELFEFSQNILENERKRLAKDLHDVVGQRLTFAKINLEMMKEADKVENSKLLNAMENIIQVGKDLKNIVSSLTPSLIENFSLLEAVKRLINEIKLNMEIEISFLFEENGQVKNKKTELNIFRIIQESINNSLKHAEANSVDVFLKIGQSEITGRIKDNGKGFDLAHSYSNSTGFGLNNMKERAELLGGNLYISSRIGSGTTIEFKLPQ